MIRAAASPWASRPAPSPRRSPAALRGAARPLIDIRGVAALQRMADWAPRETRLIAQVDAAGEILLPRELGQQDGPALAVGPSAGSRDWTETRRIRELAAPPCRRTSGGAVHGVALAKPRAPVRPFRQRRGAFHGIEGQSVAGRNAHGRLQALGRGRVRHRRAQPQSDRGRGPWGRARPPTRSRSHGDGEQLKGAAGPRAGTLPAAAFRAVRPPSGRPRWSAARFP